jgi:DNA-binding GntR family transcriptional regulator
MNVLSTPATTWSDRLRTMHFKRDRTFQTKIDIAADRIRESILDGRLKPRERIQINNVAEELGFSIIPVREGIRRLEVEGFLEIKPHKGVYIREPNIEELANIFEVRILLECRAARLAAERITASDLEQLRAVHVSMGRLSEELDRSSVLKYFSLNRRFHGIFYKSSGNPFLCRTIDSIAIHIQPHLLRFISSSMSRYMAMEDHEEILRACVERNVQLAEDKISEHLRRILATIIELTTQPENR